MGFVGKPDFNLTLFVMPAYFLQLSGIRMVSVCIINKQQSPFNKVYFLDSFVNYIKLI